MSAYRKSAQVDMTHGSVLGRAALFALPICAGNILQLLYSTVDTLVIGNFCDTTALASVATSSQPLEILLCVFVGIGSGISILVSQAVGRGDRDQLQKLVRTSVWLLFAASLPLTVIGFLLGPWMLQLMQVPADAMPGAVLYLRITMLGILGNMGYNFNAGLLRGIGNSSSSLLLLFISCAANIVLDLVLTGALGLGIGGVAAATAITLFLSWICSIFTFAAAAQNLRCLFCPAALMPGPCVRSCALVCRWG
jgi:Na+-driven multidrug efflux pump